MEKLTTSTLTTTVTEKMLAVNVGSGSLKVLATPTLAALFEKVAVKIADTYLEPGNTTVGTCITVNHNAPTPLGEEITVTATLVKQEGRFFTFTLSAKDAHGQIATGTHTRVSVGSEKFQAKADAKA
jgi:fluoroacetyl-CoA thioesterase